MRWGAILGWGIAIYAILLLSWNIIVIHGLASSAFSRIIQLVVLVIAATVAGRSLKFRSWTDILPYSIGWALVMAVIDMLYSVPIGGWAIFTNWNLWVGYALVIILPLLAPLTRRHQGEPAQIT